MMTRLVDQIAVFASVLALATLSACGGAAKQINPDTTTPAVAPVAGAESQPSGATPVPTGAGAESQPSGTTPLPAGRGAESQPSK